VVKCSEDFIKAYSIGKRLRTLMVSFKIREMRNVLKNEQVIKLFEIFNLQGFNKFRELDKNDKLLYDSMQDILSQNIEGKGRKN
jgi:hypothetical protein